MVLPVRSETIRFGKVDLPCIRLRTWWTFLMTRHPKYVLGGFNLGTTSRLLLETFWKNLEKNMPSHAVYSMFDSEARVRCIPFYLHMDEGVGQRKRAVLVISAQTLFGLNTCDRFSEAYKTANVRTPDDAYHCMSGATFHSSKGSTFLSRFLFTTIPKKNYSKKNEDVFHGILRHLAEECCALMQSGINLNGARYYPICLGLKGDAPMLGKAGYFTRYFATMGKNKGCCHECLAGLDTLDFEDCTPQASWIGTIGLEPPWKPTRVSALTQIPSQSLCPEKFYRKDPFHIFKQSLGGYFIASTLVVTACDLGLFTEPGQSTAVANVLDQAYEDFYYYVRFEWKGKNINHLKSFTKEILHFPRVDSFPSARFKGSDCMMLVRWLRHLCLNGKVDPDLVMRPGVSLTQQDGKPFESQLFTQILKASTGAVQFFHILHTEGLWLTPAMARQAADSCQDFCTAYCALARTCYDCKWMRFRLEPCLHHFVHFAVELRQLLDAGVPYIYSPAADLCEADEDFVGKISRGTRVVHMQSMTQRTIDRYLLRLWFEF